MFARHELADTPLGRVVAGLYGQRDKPGDARCLSHGVHFARGCATVDPVLREQTSRTKPQTDGDDAPFHHA